MVAQFLCTLSNTLSHVEYKTRQPSRECNEYKLLIEQNNAVHRFSLHVNLLIENGCLGNTKLWFQGIYISMWNVQVFRYKSRTQGTHVLHTAAILVHERCHARTRYSHISLPIYYGTGTAELRDAYNMWICGLAQNLCTDTFALS